MRPCRPAEALADVGRVIPFIVFILFGGSATAQLSQVSPIIQQLVAKSELDDLRWPDFHDYRKHLTAFYEPRGYEPAWTRNGVPTAQAMAVLGLLKAADGRGIHAEDYDAPRWDARVGALRTGRADAQARFDVALSVSLMRYISDLHIGRVNPRNIAIDLDIEHKKYDLPTLLLRIKDDPDPTLILEEVEPPYEGYRLLRAALGRYRKLAAEGDQRELPVVKILEPGDSYAGLPQLVAFLKRVGDLPTTAKTGDTYDGAVVEAVKKFQRRHGLDADGRIGAATLEQLNVPLSRRVDQIRWTMERWRWLPSHLELPAVVVNIPEFILRGFESGDRPAITMPVVVGKAMKTETPVFQESLEYLIFQPYWNVPPSIQRKEIAPKLSASYLRRHDYEVVDGSGRVVSSITPQVLDSVRKLRYRIRQKPGPKNALGKVKFIFPNPNNIYFHDTPSQAAFEQSRRDFSHGCIRVSDPAGLATWLLKNDPAWSREAVEKAMTEGPPDRQVKLQRHVPVLILYGTAVAEPGGDDVRFFEDIYGHDATLENALAQGYPYPG